MADDDDMPPPLEDLSHVLGAVASRKPRAAPQPRTAPRGTPPATAAPAPVIPAPAKQASRPAQAASAPAASAGPKKTGFGGLQGGFLNRPPPAKRPSPSSSSSSASSASSSPSSSSSGTTAARKAAEEDIPTITAKPAERLRLPEVQAALSAPPSEAEAEQHPSILRTAAASATAGLLAQEEAKRALFSPALLDKLRTDPVLAKGLENPRIMSAMAAVQADPAAASRQFSADPELQAFLKRWLEVTGTELGKLSPQQQQQQKKKPLIVEAGSAADVSTAPADDPYLAQPSPETMQRWLSNPAIRAALEHPATNHILQELKRDASLFPKYARENPAIRLLVQAGILRPPPGFKL